MNGKHDDVELYGCYPEFGMPSHYCFCAVVIYYLYKTTFFLEEEEELELEDLEPDSPTDPYFLHQMLALKEEVPRYTDMNF